jgi:hypothetical protein
VGCRIHFDLDHQPDHCDDLTTKKYREHPEPAGGWGLNCSRNADVNALRIVLSEGTHGGHRVIVLSTPDDPS